MAQFASKWGSIALSASFILLSVSFPVLAESSAAGNNTDTYAKEKPGFNPNTASIALASHNLLAKDNRGQDSYTVLPTIEELMQAVIAVYGSKEKLMALAANCTVYGTSNVSNSDLPETSNVPANKFREIDKGNKIRIDLTSEAKQLASNKATVSAATLAFDGQEVWKSEGGQVTDLTGHVAILLATDGDHRPSALAHFGEPGYKFTLLGSTEHEQVSCYAVEMVRQDQNPVTFFINKQTNLVQAIGYQHYDIQSKTTIDIVRDYSLWKSALGTMVAFKQKETSNSGETTNLAIDEINEDPVADEVFVKPRPLSIQHLYKPQVVPFEFSNQEILLKVALNKSEPATFLLDSGSSTTIVDRGVAASLLLDKQGSTSVQSAGGKVSTTSTILSQMEIGPVILNNVPAVIADLSWQSKQLGQLVAGIIGNNILSQYATTIDYVSKAIVFDNADSYKADDKEVAIPFSHPSAPEVKATINGAGEQVFFVDTGSVFNSLPYALGHQIDKSGISVSEGIGLDGKPVRLGKANVDSLTINGITLHKIAFNYPLDNQPTGGKLAGGNNIGILGNDFWQNFIVTFDFTKHKLFLKRNVIAQKKQEIDSLVTAGDTSLIIQRNYRQAEQIYQKALASAQGINDKLAVARLLGRLGLLHRLLAKDLSRPDQTPIAYDYFKKAMDTARAAESDKTQIILPHDLTVQQIEARILADWGLLYSDNNRAGEAEMTIKTGLQLAGDDDPEIDVDYAVYLYRSQQYPQMQEYLNRALALEPGNWHALWYQVKLYDLANDKAGSERTLRTILKYYPASKLAQDKLNTLLKPPEQAQ
jgi:hypothetical protein